MLIILVGHISIAVMVINRYVRADSLYCRYLRGLVAVSGVVFVDENINLPTLKNASINLHDLPCLRLFIRGIAIGKNILVLYCWKNVIRL